MNFTRIALATAALALSSLAAQAADISGAGATFPYPIYAKWADAYKKETGIGLNYQSIGSGGGIKQIQAKTVDFGASDAQLKDDQLAKDGLVQFPTVIGGVVPVVNIAGVKPGQIKLTGQVLGDIYLGKVTKWSDPAIKAIKYLHLLLLLDFMLAQIRHHYSRGCEGFRPPSLHPDQPDAWHLR